MHSILPFVSKPQKRNPGYGTGYGESQSGGIFLSVNKVSVSVLNLNYN